MVWIWLLLCPAGLYAQDTTYLPLEDMLERDFGPLQTSLNEKHLLNRVIDLQKSNFDRFSALNDSDFTELDWITLLQAYNLSLPKGSPYLRNMDAITQQVFDYQYTGYVEDEIMTLPVGVVSFKGTYIPEEHFLNGNIKYQNNQFVQVQPTASTHLAYRLHLAAALLEGDIPRQKVYFVLEPNFLLVDDDRVDYVELNVNGVTTRLYPGQKTLVDLTEATLPLKFNTVFRIGPSVANRYQPQTKSLITPPEIAFDPTVFGPHTYTYVAFDEPSTFSLRLRYGIKFGACNNTGKIRKPVIMLHGYRPPIQNIWPTLQTLYHTKFNFKGADYGSDGFVDLLVKNGYDVIICRIDPGYESIAMGGALMASFIKNVVNPQKASTGSKHENIVLGFSMGGQYWRYALMKMEKEHFNGSSAHHQTRLWIPVDSPNEGANVPLAHQYTAWSLKNHLGGGLPTLNVGYNGLMTNGSKDQMRYHFDGSQGDNGAPHQFHANRVQLINTLENTFNLGPGLTQYPSYPSATRNVAISAGSHSLDAYSGLVTGLPTYQEQSLFMPLLYEKRWDVRLNSASFISSLSPNPGKEVYHRKITFKWVFNSNTNVLVDDKKRLYEWLELDNCFASYHNTIPKTINFGLRWNSLFGFTDYVYDGNLAFMPMLSALAIHPRYWPNNMRIDLQDFNVMYNSFDLNTPSDYYGYPHLGRPNDYMQVTPMDAVFCDRYTHEHITLIDPNGLMLPYFDQSKLITFLLNEVEPWYLDLQNQELGKYARDNYVYQAKYMARNLIRTGKEITPKTPFGWYIARPNADLELQSGEVIEFKPGTHFQAGSKVHAYIQGLCHLNGSRSLELSEDEEPEAYGRQQEINTTANGSTAPVSVVYPNPSDGTFTLRCDALDAYGEGTLYLYNAQGRQVAVLPIRNLQTVRLDETTAQNHLLIGRIVVNDGVVCENKIFIQR